MDTWRGGTLFRSSKSEMLSMFVFLVAPFFTLMICLMIQYQEAWRMTAGVWCALVRSKTFIFIYMYHKPSHVLIHLSFSGFGHVLCLGTGGYNQRGKFMFLVG
jgi:hypothetical protein